MVKAIKVSIAKLIIKLSPLRWAEQQLPNNDFSEKLEANKDAIYNAIVNAKADHGESL